MSIPLHIADYQDYLNYTDVDDSEGLEMDDQDHEDWMADQEASFLREPGE